MHKPDVWNRYMTPLGMILTLKERRCMDSKDYVEIFKVTENQELILIGSGALGNLEILRVYVNHMAAFPSRCLLQVHRQGLPLQQVEMDFKLMARMLNYLHTAIFHEVTI